MQIKNLLTTLKNLRFSKRSQKIVRKTHKFRGFTTFHFVQLSKFEVFRNSLFLIFIATAMLVFSGCSMGTDGKQSGLTLGSGSSKQGGSGVALSFADGNPPSEINKDQPVNFAFVFTNYQTHPITDLKMKIKGIEWGYVKGLQENAYNVKEIPKATSTGPGVYPGLIEQGVTLVNFAEEYNFNPLFDYCYTAKTNFREAVCVPSKDKNTCDTSVDKSKSENGPLRVTVDRINSIGDKVRVDFKIMDSGSGQAVNECFKTDDYANEYSIKKVTLGTNQGNCEAVSGYNIINGESNFYCEFARSGGDSAYPSDAIVELEYKYQQSTQLKIKAVDLNAGYN